jgi:hypothetical protein
MAHTVYSVDKLTYWIAYSNDMSTIHHGKLQIGQSLKTGQDNLYKTLVESKWLTKLDEFGVTLEDVGVEDEDVGVEE